MNTDVIKTLDLFFQQFKIQKYKRHQLLINAGEEPAGLFYLKEGVVRQYAISANGEELTINTFKSGSFFPLAWIVNDDKGSHYFEAASPASLRVAPKAEALNFLKNHPEILWDLVKRIYKGLDGYFMRMEHLMLGSARSRLVAELLIYARRFGQSEGGAIRVNLKLTEKDLAAQSGITRETVSREIQKLKQKKLISFSKSTLVINNIDQLEDVMEIT